MVINQCWFVIICHSTSVIIKNVYGGMDCVVLSSLRAILTLIEKYVNSEGTINMHTSDAELNMNRI